MKKFNELTVSEMEDVLSKLPPVADWIKWNNGEYKCAKVEIYEECSSMSLTSGVVEKFHYCEKFTFKPALVKGWVDWKLVE